MDARRLPASHAAAALGLVKWSTQLATYLSLTQGRPWDENPEEPQRGVRLKPALRAWANTLLEDTFTRQLSEQQGGVKLSHFSAHPAGMNMKKAALLLKTPKSLARWLEAGDEEIDGEVPSLMMPHDVEVECALTAAVMMVDLVHVGVLVGGELKLLAYERNLEFEAKMLTHLRQFWEVNVVGQRPPRAVEGDEDTLRELWPKVTRPKPVAFPSLPEVYQQAVLTFAKAQRMRTAAQKVEKETRPKVVQAIADYPSMVDFPPESGVERIDFEQRAPGMNPGIWKAIAEELLAKMSPRARSNMLKKYTPTEGTRVLRPFFLKEVA